MIELEFRQLAASCLADVPFDAPGTLQGVYRRRRRHQAGMAARLGGAATAILLAAGIVVGGGSGNAPTSVRFEPFAVAAAADAPALATVDGFELTYLPDGMSATPVHSESRPAGQEGSYSDTLACFADHCEGGLGVTVSRGEGLTIDTYLDTHWVGASTETTVNGQPALALNVRGDDAAGVLWSPSPGVVVEIHVGNHLRSELRSIVEGLRLGAG